MAEGVFRNEAAARPSLIGDVDSSGTGAYHTGDPPDPRTMATLRRHAITDYEHFAHMVTKEDFLRYDYLLAMDKWNLSDLLDVRESVIASLKRTGTPAVASTPSSRASKGTRASSAAALADAASTTKVAEVRLFGDFLPGGKILDRPGAGEVVQDPYYGGANGFEVVYQQVARFSRNFLDYLERQQALASDGADK